MRAQLLFACLSGCLVLSTVGCGGGAPPGPEKLPTVPVSGIVTFQGTPLPNATVSFQHSEGKVSSTGKTDAAGAFTLSTYGANDGAPVGTYNVTVAVSATQELEPGVLAPEPEGGFKSTIPPQYANPATSGLKVEIPAGGKPDVKLDLN